MKSNISIDVSLLAIVLAMYFTNQDDRMTLILMVALITHVLLTSGGDNEDLRHPYLGAQPVGAQPVGAQPVGAQPVGAQPVGAQPVGAQLVGAQPVGAQPSVDHVKTTVSSGVFERNISTPQTNFTSSIFPSTSQEANGKLADSRGSFFEALVS